MTDDLKDQVLGALARGFCTRANEHKEMDVELCKAQAKELMKLPFFTLPAGGMRAAFQADPEYANAWHCNIACLLTDAGVSHDNANERARGFMNLAFGVTDYEPKQQRKIS